MNDPEARTKANPDRDPNPSIHRLYARFGDDSIQDVSNEYPDGECPASYPKEAVATLFAGRAAGHE